MSDQTTNQKRLAREADERAMRSGQKSREQVQRENAFVPRAIARGPIDFNRIGRAR